MTRFHACFVPAAVGLGAWLAVTVTAAEPANDNVPAGYQKTAPLLDDLGDFHFPVSTDVPLAQRYFDQGMILTYGFNHAEAARSFREAQKLDPRCAMAYWGEALVLGPNINAPMSEENVPLAWAALQKAKKRRKRATPRERALINALAARYAAEPTEDRSELDVAYADAMRKVARRFADDDNAQVMFAEALMDTMPWNYWLEGGKPQPLTRQVLGALERVITRNPNHAGANHLYIHAVEAAHPAWGVACAERLGPLVPGAGHLVHMPCHIFVRVGRYNDASEANEKAIQADNTYVTQCHAQGMYPLAYMPHNGHFLWFTAAMEGRSERSIRAGRDVSNHVDQNMMRQPGLGTLQHFYILPMYALVRFGRWEEVLAEPEPAADLKYPRGVWHMGRGMALARKGQLDAARKERAALSELAGDPELEHVTIWDLNGTRDLLQIADAFLAANIAAAEKDYETAIERMQHAVAMEDELTYDEPPTWFSPARQALGALLLDADRPAEAEEAFRADLAKYPDNGWSLFGLHQSLAAQGKSDEAARVKQAFDKSWSRADVELKAALF